ncbi:hypothetical protein NMY22_g17326 [Coprinellus aureogranulatus]|nr:hypothetical protein NMY22_g17326 [Coprinellus aureogranulatus]
MQARSTDDPPTDAPRDAMRCDPEPKPPYWEEHKRTGYSWRGQSFHLCSRIFEVSRAQDRFRIAPRILQNRTWNRIDDPTTTTSSAAGGAYCLSS